MSNTTLASLFALVLGVSVMGCSPEAPATPTYTKDVQPILAAHCVRCHNADLNGGIDPLTGVAANPVQCHLNQLADSGDCSTTGVAANLCKRGVEYCAALMTLYIASPEPTVRMPPPPSDPLNDWEMDVLKRWATVTPLAP